MTEKTCPQVPVRPRANEDPAVIDQGKPFRESGLLENDARNPRHTSLHGICSCCSRSVTATFSESQESFLNKLALPDKPAVAPGRRRQLLSHTALSPGRRRSARSPQRGKMLDAWRDQRSFRSTSLTETGLQEPLQRSINAAGGAQGSSHAAPENRVRLSVSGANCTGRGNKNGPIFV